MPPYIGTTHTIHAILHTLIVLVSSRGAGTHKLAHASCDVCSLITVAPGAAHFLACALLFSQMPMVVQDLNSTVSVGGQPFRYTASLHSLSFWLVGARHHIHAHLQTVSNHAHTHTHTHT